MAKGVTKGKKSKMTTQESGVKKMNVEGKRMKEGSKAEERTESKAFEKKEDKNKKKKK